MSLVINHNLMAMNASRNLSTSYNRLSTSIQRLSSGQRINSAADDAAGLAVRELMRSDVRTINQGVRNANDAISMIQTADGALQVIDEKLIRMKELAEQASTGTYTTAQRLIINSEFVAMRDEIDRIAKSTRFNGIKLLDGELCDINSKGLYYWAKLDGNATDSSGNGFNGIVNGATPTTDRFGNTNGAYDFNGVNNDIQIPNFSMNYNQLSLVAWVKLDTNTIPNESPEILIAPFANTFQIEVGGNPSPGGLNSVLFDSTTRLASNSNIFSLGGWHHVVGTYDGENSKIYLDGNLVAERTGSGGRNFGPGTMFIGSQYGGNSFWDGKIDDVRVYDRGLSEDEVKALYNGNNELLLDVNATIHFGPNNVRNVDNYDVTIGNATAKALSIDNLSISTQESAQISLDMLNQAIISKDNIRANLGAMQNRLTNTITNLSIQAENLQAAESRISDTDIATEMTEFTRQQILAQAANSMLAQANSLPQMALQLMGG